jgi:hypothetical protein
MEQDVGSTRTTNEPNKPPANQVPAPAPETQSGSSPPPPVGANQDLRTGIDVVGIEDPPAVDPALARVLLRIMLKARDNRR